MAERRNKIEDPKSLEEVQDRTIGPMEGNENDQVSDVEMVEIAPTGSDDTEFSPAPTEVSGNEIPGAGIARAFSTGSGAGAAVDGLSLPNTDDEGKMSSGPV